MTSNSNTSIMSIGEMIDTAFGDPAVNIVNHKLLQTILYLLARQLRVLERRVEIEMAAAMPVSSGSSLSVTEVKMHAMHKKKKGPIHESDKGRAIKTAQSAKSRQEPGSLSDKTSSSKEKSSSTKSTTDKTPTDTTTTTGKSSSGKTTTSTEKSTEKSSTTKSTDKSTSDKSSTEKSTDKSSTEKSSTEKSSTAKSSTEKSSTEQSSTAKSSTEKSSTEKSSTEKSSTEKSSTEKSSTEKSSTEKSSTEKSSTAKSSTEKSSSAEKSSTAKSSSAEKSSIAKSSTEKSSSAEKISSGKEQPRGTDKTTKKTSKDYRKLLEEIEEQRERELRVIHQRKTSREEQDKTPTPMASLDSVEAQYEKLLIVERVPTKDSKGKKETPSAPRLSVVTQEQFAELSATVEELMEKLAPIGMPEFPENMELMEELRKNASLTDAMAALQLSARLEAVEKTLRQMLSLVTELATKTGIELTGDQSEFETEVLMEAKDKHASGKTSSSSRKSKTLRRQTATILPEESMQIPVLEVLPPAAYHQEPGSELSTMPTEKPSALIDFVTYEELDSAMQDLYDEIKKAVMGITTRSTANAENAFKIVSKLEGKLEASLDLGDRMEDLEALVSNYADKINALDTGLSAQMTNYQEQLTQMQHDLETGLENMAEQLANTDTDTTAVAELNTHFTNLQQDLDNSAINQRELKDNQRALSLDLEGLWKQIELLRETKSDREEVTDALRDKAGIGALNGLVSLQQFDAVRGDFEKRIGSAYDKFNNQEIIWQKAIDDLLKELNDKADYIQMVSLRDEITKYLDMLKGRMQAMFDIVGEPNAAAITRRLHRDATCISCASPAWMELDESTTVPALPAMQTTRPPTIGAEATKPKEDGDHGVLCYPGRPIPHPRDVRSHYCQRFCGGSHTLINKTVSRSPPGMVISPLRKPSPLVGTDEKVCKTDENSVKTPCTRCNPLVSTTPQPTEAQTPEAFDTSSNMTPSDFRGMTDFNQPSMEVSLTPPPPLDEDL